MELTHFQKTVKRALDLSDEFATTVPRGWPKNQEILEDTLFTWNDFSKKKVTGLQIMTAVPVIWSRKPDSDSKSQGRTVLYHPLSGAPISEGSTFDGVSWEVLAFLRWANRAGHLQWADEITIVREIKEAGGVIKDLPADRFYAKYMLPVEVDGRNIDWSDVDLAKAKKFVCSGEISPENTSSEPIYFDENSLEGLLGSLTEFRDQSTRSRLLKNLPMGACGTIPRSSAPSTDLYNIVSAVEGMGRLSNGQMAIDVLIDNAASMFKGLKTESKIRKFKTSR